MSDLVLKAKEFATNKYPRIDQGRTVDAQPFGKHLASVAEIVEGAGGDERMIAAAWLHDMVEDTPATVDELQREFGRDVAMLVSEVTDASVGADGDEDARFEVNLWHLAYVSPRAKTLKLADLLDTGRYVCKNHPAKVPRFVSEASRLLPLLVDGGEKLHSRLAKLLEQQGSVTKVAPDQQAFPDWFIPNRGRRQAMELMNRAFLARDITELLPLAPLGGELAAPTALASRTPCRVLGLRDEQGVRHYVRREASGAQVETILSTQVLPEEARLGEVIEVLSRHDFCFVRSSAGIDQIIDRNDMEKPVVRMWLFGLLTMIEDVLAARIQRRWPDEGWTSLLSEGRLQKARELHAERTARGHTGSLLGCLQLADKTSILFDDPAEVARFGYAGKSAAKKLAAELEALRNNLAHSQSIVAYDWPQIIRFGRRVEGLWRLALAHAQQQS